MKSIRQQKKNQMKKLNETVQVVQMVSDMIYECAYAAVEQAHGHGKRYMLCASH